MKKETSTRPYAHESSMNLEKSVAFMKAEIVQLERSVKAMELELKHRGAAASKEATEALRKLLTTVFAVPENQVSRAMVNTDGRIMVQCIGRDGAGWLDASMSVERAAEMIKDPSNSFSGVGR